MILIRLVIYQPLQRMGLIFHNAQLISLHLTSRSSSYIYTYIYNQISEQLMLQCIKSVLSNPVQGRIQSVIEILFCYGYCGFTFNNCFSYIMMVSFIGGGNWSTRRKPPTCRKSLTKLYTIILYRAHLIMSGIRIQNFSGDRH